MECQKSKVRSILIIDDDKDDFELVVEVLQDINPDISVHFISSCEEIIKYKDQSFDLVLLDINMPHYDGFDWLKSIREHGYSSLPVIMYTNSLSPLHISKAYEEGANLYFSKPETFSHMIKGFRALIAMDWSNPDAITQQYCQQGHYKTFQFK